MPCCLRTLVTLERSDDFLDLLHPVLVRDKNRVVGIHGNDVGQPYQRDEALVADGQRVAAIAGDHVAAVGVAVAILFDHRPQRRPRSHVVPAHVDRDDRGAVGFFHHRVVDRIGRTGGKTGLVQAQEVGVHGRLVQGLPRQLDHARLVLAQLLEVARGKEGEHAAVPEIFAAGDIGFGGCLVRFFDEAQHVAHALARRGIDVTVARFRRRGHDAEGDQITGLGRFHRNQHRGAECSLVRNHMVGRQYQQHRVVATLHGAQRSHGDGGGRVAADRFQDQRGRRGADLAQLLGDHEPVFFIGNHQRRIGARQAAQSQPGGLQQGFLAQQRQELLGMRLARQGPEARAGAAGKDDGDQRRHGIPGQKWSYILPWTRQLGARGRASVILRPFPDRLNPCPCLRENWPA